MIVTISKIDFVTLKSACNADLGRKKGGCKVNQNDIILLYASTIYQSLKMGGGIGGGAQKITKRLRNEIVTQKHKHTNNNFSSFQNLW